MLKLISHPNVVDLVEVLENKKKIYIVMELIRNGDLFEYIKERRILPESEVALISYQVLQTLRYLHQCGIVHRDIKPENIMVQKHERFDRIENVKLADFGLSKLVGPTDLCYDACGTLGYVAPEVLKKEGYGKEVDLWSVAVMMYLMLSGLLPFDGKGKRDVYR